MKRERELLRERDEWRGKCRRLEERIAEPYDETRYDALQEKLIVANQKIAQLEEQLDGHTVGDRERLAMTGQLVVYRTADAALFLGTSANVVRKAVQTGELRVAKPVGAGARRGHLFLKPDLLAWLDTPEVGSVSKPLKCSTV